MGKESRNEAFGRVYREFSRQKYNKYKAQFPKLRQSQIVVKIIKEWDALDPAAKENLQKIYEEKKFLTNEDISSSEALRKADRVNKEARIAAQRSAITQKQHSSTLFSATRLHSNIKQVQREQSDFNRRSEAIDESRLDEYSSAVAQVKKKKIAKDSQRDYIHFFKKQYSDLKKQHPRWTTQQVASVIKLLWKKTKNQGKSLRKNNGKLITSKPLSGRRYFRRVKRLDRIQTKIKWKLLPFQTKRYWSDQARGGQVDKSELRGVVSYKPISIKAQSVNTLSFMSNLVS